MYYLAELAALRQAGFVGTWDEYQALPAMVLEDMRLVLEMRATAGAREEKHGRNV